MSIQDNAINETLDINDSRCTMDIGSAIILLSSVIPNHKIVLHFLSELISHNKIIFKIESVVIDKYNEDKELSMVRTKYSKDESREAFYEINGRIYSVDIEKRLDEYVMTIYFLPDGATWFIAHVINPTLDPEEIGEYASNGSDQAPPATAYPDLRRQFLRSRRPGPKPKYWTHMAWAELARRAVENNLKDDNGDRLSQSKARQQLLQWVHNNDGDIGEDTARQIVEHLWTALGWR